MRNFRLFLLTFSLMIFLHYQVRSQSPWGTVISSRGNFSFSFPPNGVTYDTLTLLSYMGNPGDSSISLQVNYMDNVYITGNDELANFQGSRVAASAPMIADPCFVDSIESVFSNYARMYQYVTEGSIEGFVNSDYQACTIRGRELTIRHKDLTGGTGFYFVFTRYFYWNQKFLAFTLSGPEQKLNQLYAYKNQLFSSISIY